MITWIDIITRLSLAALFGAMVGLERERKDWAAGLRTHMMVCVGACLTMMVSAFGFRDILGTPSVVLDPSRIAAQVISGIGFIGAGTILFLRQEVIRGLTTAAGLWTVAAIGLAAGGGMYFAAAAATVLVIIILWLLKPLERRMFGRYRIQTLRLTVNAAAGPYLLETIHNTLAAGQVEMTNLIIEKKGADTILLLRLIQVRETSRMMSLVGKLQQIPDIREVSWDKSI